MSIWTQEKIEALKRLRDEGRTTAEIARALGAAFTPAMVVGKAKRLKLTKLDRNRLTAPVSVAPKPSAPISEWEARFQEAGLVALDDLGRAHCRWPCAEGRYCGRARVVGAYCLAHARRAYVRARPAARSVEKLAA
ncbi:MAG: GcrA family cell cycle regulator [Hyphomicrobiales bacterium]|nr:GcrA family cell cycle regulator [Hyphomicrobiales bacterium]